MRVDKPDHTEDEEVNDLTAGDVPEDTTDEEGDSGEESSGEEETQEEHNPSGAANLTLTAISTLTGIPYVTIARYAREHEASLPFEGRGKSRRYYPAAVEMFKTIKAEAGGRRKSGNTAEGVTAEATGKRPRRSRRARRPAEHTTASTADQPKRMGRPRKNPETVISPVRRGRQAHSRVITPALTLSSDQIATQIVKRAHSSAETAYRRAHLTAKLESLQDVIDHLNGERESLKAEIDKLA